MKASAVIFSLSAYGYLAFAIANFLAAALQEAAGR
jgi:hypothetical protein